MERKSLSYSYWLRPFLLPRHFTPFYNTCRACSRLFTKNEKFTIENFCNQCATELHASNASGRVLSCGHASIMHIFQHKTDECYHRLCSRKAQTEQSPCMYCHKRLASSACISLGCGHVCHYSCFRDHLQMVEEKGSTGGYLTLSDVSCAICSSVVSWNGTHLSVEGALTATLECACVMGDLLTTKKLARKGLQGASLHKASYSGQIEVIRMLSRKIKHLEMDKRVGLLDCAPLHAAVMGGHENVVTLLVGLGADLNVRKYTNYTPLHEAAKEGNGAIAKLLLVLGANVDVKADYNVTPLHLAVGSGSCEVVKCLLEYGANVNAMNNHGYTPLKIAAIHRNGGTVKLLLDAGARVDEDILSVVYDPQILSMLRKEPPQKNSTAGDQEQCTVCLCPCEVPKKLKCGHSFCWECLSNLISKSFDSCPNCRAPIVL